MRKWYTTLEEYHHIVVIIAVAPRARRRRRVGKNTWMTISRLTVLWRFIVYQRDLSPVLHLVITRRTDLFRFHS